MIYFDRVEVVNMLDSEQGKFCTCAQFNMKN